jgi:hypothetical protein
MHRRGDGWTAASAIYGRNNKLGGDFNAFVGELTHVFGANTAYGRVEAVQVESNLLRFGIHTFIISSKPKHVPDTGEGRDTLTTVTIGGVRTIAKPWGIDLAAGGDVTFYAVPEILKPLYSDHPVSFHIFFRVRPPAPTGRMFDMTMAGR